MSGHAGSRHLSLQEPVVELGSRGDVQVMDLDCIGMNKVDDFNSPVQLVLSFSREPREDVDAKFKTAFPHLPCRLDKATDIVSPLHGREDFVASALESQFDADRSARFFVGGQKREFPVVYTVGPCGYYEAFPPMEGRCKVIEFPELFIRGEGVGEGLKIKGEMVCLVPS